jgi:hypothetical protein
MDSNEKTEQPMHLEDNDHRSSRPVEMDDVHGEVTAQDVSAATLAEEVLYVDDKRANELRSQMATSKQGGWTPITREEQQLNSRLNWKLDLMVRSQIR